MEFVGDLGLKTDLRFAPDVAFNPCVGSVSDVGSNRTLAMISGFTLDVGFRTRGKEKGFKR